MGETRETFSDFVRYRLKSDIAPSINISEPIGWEDDDFELDRHKDYHGIFTSFSNKLGFPNEAKEYIMNAYVVGGVNANCRLTKEVLVDNDGDVKWKLRYSALADYNKRKIKKGILNINFTSNNLAEYLKTHESDDFEMERPDSIDGVDIGDAIINQAEIKGRSIIVTGENILQPLDVTVTAGSSFHYHTPVTILSAEEERRHSAVVEPFYSDEQYIGFPQTHSGVDVFKNITAAHLFYHNRTAFEENIDVEVLINLDFNLNAINGSVAQIYVNIKKFKFNETSGFFDENEVVQLYFDNAAFVGDDISGNIKIEDVYNVSIEYDEALMLEILVDGARYTLDFTRSPKSSLRVSEIEHFDPTPQADFMFIHDIADRLVQIITGKKDSFYSKYFGRDNHPTINYVESGIGGFIGAISGFWLRVFKRDSDNYKSLTISLKDLIESLRAVFNIGVSIESTIFGERLRFEELDYYYQPEIVVRMGAISDPVRTTESDLLFSGLSFGYEHKGDYENSNGLNEPNTDTDYVTPIRKSKNKYIMKSKIRGDELGAEMTRRKPEWQFPNEDTKRDDSNWFLDLKKTIGTGYEQMEWYDRLTKLPTGIHDPASWRSFFFTPLEMLFRHAWVFRSGLEPYLDKFIKHTRSSANKTVKTQFIGRDEHTASDDILVGKVDRSKIAPEKLKFNFKVDDNLMEWILGTTKKEVNGEIEEIPNWYFKMAWINEEGLEETGYLLNLKPKGRGAFTFLVSNERII